jgi:hypothetical protein
VRWTHAKLSLVYFCMAKMVTIIQLIYILIIQLIIVSNHVAVSCGVAWVKLDLELS